LSNLIKIVQRPSHSSFHRHRIEENGAANHPFRIEIPLDIKLRKTEFLKTSNLGGKRGTEIPALPKNTRKPCESFRRLYLFTDVKSSEPEIP
jgi:hypothetical protein